MTEEDIKKLREFLKAVTGKERITVGMTLEKLSDGKPVEVEVGKIYHLYCNPIPVGLSEVESQPWFRILITYKRGGMVFYRFLDEQGVYHEHTMKEGSITAARLIPEVIETEKWGISSEFLALTDWDKESDPLPVFILDDKGNAREAW